jgi:leucyl/phenylalanyl-tRNA--protein transferase
MPIYWLPDELIFPPVEGADEDGVVALGGDLSPERLLLAYKSGIFPWYSEDEPIVWWAPNPRFVLYTNKLKVSKSMRSLFNKNSFKVTMNTAFEEVITNCKTIERGDQEGTWIDEEMKAAYTELNRQGWVHSVEAWKDGELVGGLYGVSIGKCFFGESMFAKVSNASKYAFISLVQLLRDKGFELIDCQVHTPHLESLGAELIPITEFQKYLSSCGDDKLEVVNTLTDLP